MIVTLLPRITRLLVSVLVVLAVLAGTTFKGVSTAQAASYSSGELVSNTVFTAQGAMGVGEIQAFLQQKGSVLASIPSNYLGDGASGRSAAQIIFDATRMTHPSFGGRANFRTSLNPQVVLVTLQKETSLITGSYVVGSTTLDNMLRIAMGYGCPDSGGCDPTYAGFTNQVMYAAAQLSLDYVRATEGTIPGQFKVGSAQTLTGNPIYSPYCTSSTISFTVANAATAALYRYTPHVCNGNANFWYFMNTWFAVLPFIPDALAFDSTDGTTYVIKGTRRWGLTGTAYYAWNFGGTAIRPITTEERAYPNGGLWTQLVLQSDGTVFYIDNGKKRPLVSPRLMDRWGFSWSDVKPLPDDIIAQVPYGLPMHELVLPDLDGTVYLATSGQLYPITAEMFNAWGFTFREAAVVPGYTISNLTQASLLTRFAIPEGGDGTVFFIDRGYGYKVSAAVARAWGFNFAGNLRSVGIPLLDERGNGGFLTTLIRQDGNGTIYLVENGKKRPITAAAWSAYRFKSADVRVMSAEVINSLPTGSVLR